MQVYEGQPDPGQDSPRQLRCADVRLKYKSTIGGARLGKLLQDMDHFAAVVLYKHILNPLQVELSMYHRKVFAFRAL